jgi:hypothetical protein
MKILPKPIAFEWDKGNIDKNFIKHKVTNQEIEEIFNSKLLKTFEDIKHSQKEIRFVALGITNKKRRLYISFTIRNQKIRIISARDQSKKERSLYEKK